MGRSVPASWQHGLALDHAVAIDRATSRTLIQVKDQSSFKV
jgi:hypothetical protein